MTPEEIQEANLRGTIIQEELVKSGFGTKEELEGLSPEEQTKLIGSKLDQLSKEEQDKILVEIAHEQGWTKDSQRLKRAEDRLRIFK
jgi:ribosomal protein L32E